MITIRFIRIIRVVIWLLWILDGIFLGINYYNHLPKNFYSNTFLLWWIPLCRFFDYCLQYISPSFQVYYTFKFLKKKNRKNFDKYISEYLSENFKNSVNYEAFKNLSFSPIHKLNTKRIGKRKYEVTISTLSEIKYTMLVISENGLGENKNKLLIDKVYGSGFEN